MVGKCVGLHPKKGGQLSRGTQKQKAVGRTTSVVTPTRLHERLSRASGVPIPPVTGNSINRGSNSLQPLGPGI